MNKVWINLVHKIEIMSKIYFHMFLHVIRVIVPAMDNKGMTHRENRCDRVRFPALFLVLRHPRISRNFQCAISFLPRRQDGV